MASLHAGRPENGQPSPAVAALAAWLSCIQEIIVRSTYVHSRSRNEGEGFYQLAGPHGSAYWHHRHSRCALPDADERRARGQPPAVVCLDDRSAISAAGAGGGLSDVQA